MDATKPEPSLVQRLPAIMLVAVLPCALVAILNAAFVLDHFYARAPYMLDAGWLSAVVHRSGVLLHNPTATQHYGWSFNCVHFSPFMALFSVLSSVVPLDRIGWYALFQGLVYAPLGLTVYFVSSRAGRVPMWRHPLTALLALAFSFSGQSIVAMEYPHFEPAISGFLCLLLACVVTRRVRWIWPLLALSLSVREDAGFHVALALAPLLYLNWKGKTVPALHQLLIKLIAVSFGYSIVAFVVQRVAFPAPPAAWKMAFFGDPLFHHLSGPALRERALWFVTSCPFVTVPLLATIVLAAARRDARYLFGWLSATPWLVANLLAYEEGKWRLSFYVGFPFIVSVFWVYLYGSLLAPRARQLSRSSMELVLAAMCIASVGVEYLRAPGVVRRVAQGMLRTTPSYPREVRVFAQAVRERRGLGRLSVDYPVGALAIDTITRDDGYYAGRLDTDTFAFHREGVPDGKMLLDLGANGISRCTRVLPTEYILCSKLDGAGASLEATLTQTVPPLLVYASFDTTGRRVTFEPRGVVISAGSSPGLVIANRPMTTGAKGSYEVAWDLVVDTTADDDEAAAAVRVELVIDGVVARTVSTTKSELPRQRLVLPFSLRADQWFGSRLWYDKPGRTVIIEDAQLRAAVAAVVPVAPAPDR